LVQYLFADVQKSFCSEFSLILLPQPVSLQNKYESFDGLSQQQLGVMVY